MRTLERRRNSRAASSSCAVALGALFHFLPALSGRQLMGRGYAQFAFWIMLLFGSVGGVGPGAPVPAWLPALSTVSAVFYFFGVIAVWVSINQTISGASAADTADSLAYNLMRLGPDFYFDGCAKRVLCVPRPG